MEFHEKLLELRKSRGLTQEELAEAQEYGADYVETNGKLKPIG